MSWIDDGLKDEARKDWAAGNAGAIFEKLWNEIEARTEEGQQKNIRVFTNDDHQIIIPVRPPKAGNPQTVSVRLSKDRSCIEAGDVRLDVVAQDDDLRLMYDGKPVSIADAARLILEPHFFPRK